MGDDKARLEKEMAFTGGVLADQEDAQCNSRGHLP
jgi:hypothetical protein